MARLTQWRATEPDGFNTTASTFFTSLFDVPYQMVYEGLRTDSACTRTGAAIVLSPRSKETTVVAEVLLGQSFAEL